MKTNIFLVVLTLISLSAYSSESEIKVEGIQEALIEAINNPKPWIPPVLEPNTVLLGIENFVVLNKGVNLKNYYFTGLEYNFREATWKANYICKRQNGVSGLDCGFRVYASNDKHVKYRFELYP